MDRKEFIDFLLTKKVIDKEVIKFSKNISDFPLCYKVLLAIDGNEVSTVATGYGPVDATFNAVKALYPHSAKLQLYQVHAVTEGTDAQATVTVRMDDKGNISTGQSADTDTVVASAKAYLNALNRLHIRRSRLGEDKKEINYKDTAV